MIWYLLYPFRGTTEPPVLSPNHPIRRAFYRHGANIARHWLAYILFSVSIAVLVCYPTVSLSRSSAATFTAKLPQHVWTSARPFVGDQSISADVTVRQVWIHGDYMGALELNVLPDALEIQNALVRNIFPAIDHKDAASDRSVKIDASRPSADYGCDPHPGDGQSWGFHSPLMYWNCSSASISLDQDRLSTIHRQSTDRSYLNFTLRPSTVFAGKSFVDNKLMAADALVITIFDKTSDPLASPWDRRFRKLAALYSDRWLFYPDSGSNLRSQLYDFQFEPISFRDTFLLVVAYLWAFLYNVSRLRKTRAVKSQLGIMITLITEMTLSVIASFTICGLLGIDLAGIPSETYPFVVFAYALDHRFRLIDAVLNYQEASAISRIANALGDVGHLAVASSVQYLAILWLLSKILYSPLQSFCAFAAAAHIFDFFFHLTFFVAVLSVDVQRLEIQDSRTRRSRRPRQYWIDAMVRGRLPISSRVACLVVPICFILVLNAHFSNFEGMWQLVRRAVSWTGEVLEPSVYNQASFIAPPINQARTPQGWLKRQDYKAAQEVINFVKPNAQRLVARVFDPLVIVIKGSNRYSSPSLSQSLAFCRELLSRHIYAFLLGLSSLLGVVTLVMQYLVWNEWPDNGDQRSSITTKILPVAHGLDVYKLITSNKAHMLSIAWDRSVVLYRFNLCSQSYTTLIIHNLGSSYYCWPISCAAIDDTGTCIALADTAGSVILHNVIEKKESKRVTLQPWEKPVIFSMFRTSRTNPATSLIAVLPGGSLSIVNVKSAEIVFCLRLSLDIVSARIFLSESGPEVIAASQSGDLNIVPLIDGTAMQKLDLAPDTSWNGPVKSLLNVESLDLCAIIQDRKVSLMDINTRLLVHRFQVPDMVPGSLRVLHSLPRRCLTCQALAVHMFSLAFTLEDQKTCVIHSFSLKPGDYNSNICLRPVTDDHSSCQTFKSVTTSFYDVSSPGTWESTNDDMLIGVRRAKPPAKTTDHELRETSSATSTATSPTLSPLIRESLRSPSRGGPSSPHHPLAWEVWTLSTATGDFSTMHLPGKDDIRTVGKPVLYAADPGPLSRLGKRTVAIALGNALHLATAGSDRIEEAEDRNLMDLAGRAKDGRMRKIGPGAKKKKK